MVDTEHFPSLIFFHYPGCVNRTTLNISEVLLFLFSSIFLQQYRHHRLHSFTNTKHITTLAADAAAVKGGVGVGEYCRLWRSLVQPQASFF